MHCIERAWERYGVALSRNDIGQLERQITERRSVLVRRELGSTEIHLVNHLGVVMVAVWGLERSGRFLRLITFLPEDDVRRGGCDRRYQRHFSRDLNGGRVNRLKHA